MMTAATVMMTAAIVMIATAAIVIVATAAIVIVATAAIVMIAIAAIVIVATAAMRMKIWTTVGPQETTLYVARTPSVSRSSSVSVNQVSQESIAKLSAQRMKLPRQVRLPAVKKTSQNFYMPNHLQKAKTELTTFALNSPRWGLQFTKHKSLFT